MPGTPKTSRVPTLPVGLDSLRAYLEQRDAGMPAALPMPRRLVQTTYAGAYREDRVEWDFEQLAPKFGPIADGFILFMELGTVSDPKGAAAFLPIELTSYSHLVPQSVPYSYAVAAFRMTAQGIELGVKRQLDAWQGVVGGFYPTSEKRCVTVGCLGAYQDVPGAIPPGCRLDAVVVTMLTDLEGASTVSVGHPTLVDAFGREISGAAGTATTMRDYRVRNLSVYPDGETIRLTFNGGVATGGQAELCVWHTDA